MHERDICTDNTVCVCAERKREELIWQAHPGLLTQQSSAQSSFPLFLSPAIILPHFFIYLSLSPLDHTFHYLSHYPLSVTLSPLYHNITSLSHILALFLSFSLSLSPFYCTFSLSFSLFLSVPLSLSIYLSITLSPLYCIPSLSHFSLSITLSIPLSICQTIIRMKLFLKPNFFSLMNYGHTCPIIATRLCGLKWKNAVKRSCFSYILFNCM